MDPSKEAADTGYFLSRVRRKGQTRQKKKGTLLQRRTHVSAMDFDDGDNLLAASLLSSSAHSGEDYATHPFSGMHDFFRGKYQVKGHSMRFRDGLDSAPYPNIVSSASSTFAFQSHQLRIDWRRLHGIDVDRIIREGDVQSLETVMDTIAYGDVMAEDTRNFTEVNFTKIFRLSQLMVQYLLHVQDRLAEHRSQLLTVGRSLRKRSEKLQSKVLYFRDALALTQRELKHSNKALNTCELLVRMQGSKLQPEQVHKCPFCDKLFETAMFRDMHMQRRHTKGNEDQVAVAVARAEEATALRVREETSKLLREEFQLTISQTKAEHERGAEGWRARIAALEVALEAKEREVQDLNERVAEFTRLALQRQQQPPGLGMRLVDDEDAAALAQANQKLQEVEEKLRVAEEVRRTVLEAKERLQAELDTAHAEVSSLKSEKRKLLSDLEDMTAEVESVKRSKKNLLKELEEERECAAAERENIGKGRGRVKSLVSNIEKKQRPSEQSSGSVSMPTTSTQLIVKAESVPKIADRVPEPVPPPSAAPIPQLAPKPATPPKKRAKGPQKGERKTREDSATRAEQAAAELWKREQEEAAQQKELERRQEAQDLAELQAREQEERIRELRQKAGDEARDVAVRAAVEEADVGGEVPNLSLADREKWMAEHPYQPLLPNKPAARAKYEHRQHLFTDTRDDIAQHFDEEIEKELPRFGIARDARGISDQVYERATTALEQRRRARMTAAPAAERKRMDYEFNTILWHIDRSVYKRDEEMVEAMLLQGDAVDSGDDISSLLQQNPPVRQLQVVEGVNKASGGQNESYSRTSDSEGDSIQEDEVASIDDDDVKELELKHQHQGQEEEEHADEEEGSDKEVEHEHADEFFGNSEVESVCEDVVEDVMRFEPMHGHKGGAKEKEKDRDRSSEDGSDVSERTHGRARQRGTTHEAPRQSNTRSFVEASESEQESDGASPTTGVTSVVDTSAKLPQSRQRASTSSFFEEEKTSSRTMSIQQNRSGPSFTSPQKVSYDDFELEDIEEISL